MRKSLTALFSIIFLFSIQFLNAQTPSAGAIAFVGIQTSSPSVFSILVVNPIPGNTVIRFTDNAWDGTDLLTNESVMTWTSPGGTLNTGTIVRFTDGGGANAQVTGGGSANGKLANLAGGDQILAFTGTVDQPAFIAGISTKNWLSSCTAESGDTSTCLPSPLINGVNAIALSQNESNLFENGFFNVVNFTGTAEEMRLAVSNVNYWTRSNNITIAGTAAWPNWNFTVGTPFPSTVRFLQSAISITEGQPATTIQLQLDFPQPVPQIIRMNVLNFGNTTPADYVLNPEAVNNVLQINVAPNQTLVSFTIAAVDDGITEGNEIVSFALANLTSGLTIGSPNTCVVTIIDVNQSLSTIEFEEVAYSITEGDAPFDIILTITPPVASAQSVTINIQNGIDVDATDYFLTPAPIGNNLTLNIPANAASTQFRFTVLNDQEVENDETVKFTITQVSNALEIGDKDTTIVTIIDNDTPILNTPDLIFNELMPQNINTIADEVGQFDPWIEVLSNSQVTETLSKLYISDDINNPLKFRFPVIGSSILNIPANGYKIVWADATTSQGPLHTNFSLNPAGGFISLYGEDGTTLLDSVSYPAIPAGKTYGRITDGADEWKIFNLPTPGAMNEDTVEIINSISASLNVENNWTVYPNPAHDFVMIKYKGQQDLKSNYVMSLYNLTGQLLAQRQINQKSISGNVLSFSMKQLQSGIYFIRIESSETSQVLKVVKN
jgi:hypothetical protein